MQAAGHRLQAARVVDRRVVGREAGVEVVRVAVLAEDDAGVLDRPGRVAAASPRRPPPRGCASACSTSASSQPGRGSVSLLRKTSSSPRAAAAPSLQARREAAVLAPGAATRIRSPKPAQQRGRLVARRRRRRPPPRSRRGRSARTASRQRCGQCRRGRAPGSRSRARALIAAPPRAAVDRPGALVGDDRLGSGSRVLAQPLVVARATRGRSAARPGTRAPLPRSASRWAIASSLSAGWWPAQPPSSRLREVLRRGGRRARAAPRRRG